MKAVIVATLSSAALLGTLPACGESSADPSRRDASSDSSSDARTDGDPNDTSDSGSFDGSVATRSSIVLLGLNDGTLISAEIELADGTVRAGDSVRVSAPASFAARSRRGVIYMTNESAGVISAMKVAPDLTLSPLGEQRNAGGAPTHISLDADERWILVANYNSDDAVTFPIASDGSIGSEASRVSPGEHAHAITLSPSNRWALVPCLGSDHIAVLSFDRETGRLAEHNTADVERGSGPRHLVFGPGGQDVYVVAEHASAVDWFTFDDEAGELTHRGRVSTLPPDFEGDNSGAEILIHPGGQFVYTSNRGHHSVAVFRRNPDGSLSPSGFAALGGPTPRSMAIDPSGRWLLAGAMGGEIVARFSVGADGSLEPREPLPYREPLFVGIFSR